MPIVIVKSLKAPFPKEIPLLGEMSAKRTKGSAASAEEGCHQRWLRVAKTVAISTESLIIQHTMMYHTTKPVCWQDKQDNKIIVSVSAGSCRFVIDHVQQAPFYTIHSLPLVKGGAEVRGGGIVWIDWPKGDTPYLYLSSIQRDDPKRSDPPPSQKSPQNEKNFQISIEFF